MHNLNISLIQKQVVYFALKYVYLYIHCEICIYHGSFLLFKYKLTFYGNSFHSNMTQKHINCQTNNKILMVPLKICFFLLNVIFII